MLGGRSPRTRSGWGALVALTFAAMSTWIGVDPVALIVLPLALVLLALPPHRIWAKVLGLAGLGFVLGSLPHESIWLLDRGWALILGAWFVLAVVFLPEAPFTSRALAATAAAALTLLALLSLHPGALSGVDGLVGSDIRASMARVAAVWKSAGPRVPAGMVEMAYRLGNWVAFLAPSEVALASVAALGLLVLAGSLAFTLQILADFSAYTDLARGTALLLGFETSENFRQPYLSLTPTDFWNRWHITLSTWLRDYIFFPVRRALLRSRVRLPEPLMISIPPLVTMFASGLWHGAGWTFVVWGLYYGALIAVYQLLGIRGDWRPATGWGRGLAWLLMFTLIVLGWAVFRAPSLTWLGQAIFATAFVRSPQDAMVALIALSMTFFYALPLWIKWGLDRLPRESWLQAAYFAAAALVTVIYLNSASPDFIYFQF